MHRIFLSIFIVFVIIDCLYSSNLPLILNKEASQWLNIPHRWRQQQQFSNEINRSLKQLEHINENGIHQFESQAMDSVSLEVLYELSRQGRIKY